MKYLILFFLTFNCFSKAYWEKGKIQSLKVSDASFVTSCSAGLIEGCLTIRKFGANPGLVNGIEKDVWDWGDTAAGNVDYTYPTDGTAPINTISGSNALDTQQVMINGLDINGNLVDQIVTLNGQNKVLLSTPLWRIYRVFSLQVETTADRTKGFLGNVYVYEDTAIVAGVPTDATKVRAYIFDGNNQTQMSQYTIPNGYTGFLIGGNAKMTRKNAATVVYRVWARPYGSVFRLTNIVTLNSLGTGTMVFPFFAPEKIPEKTDFAVSAESDATVGVAIEYFIILLKNSTFGL